MSRLINESRDREYQRRSGHAESFKRDANGRFLPKRGKRQDHSGAAPASPLDP